jgi:Mg-chelatase subunit ChlD
VIDPDALSEFLDDDPDAAMALLADMVAATDEQLRELARAQAGRVMVEAARSGPQRRRGVGRLRRVKLSQAEGDVDVDASLDALVAARGTSTAPDPAEVVVGAWQRPDVALCLLVDRSGSMSGDRLASAAVAAAAVMFRVPLDCSVVAFAEDAVVVCAQDEQRDPDEVVSDLLRLRGFGVTDVGLALRTAAGQLARSTAGRRVAVLLSDCRTTSGGDPLGHVAGIDELVVLAPEDDTADAETMAEAVGARWTTVGGPSTVAEALVRVLGPAS